MGGGVSTYSTTPTRVDNPYTISNLQFNCKVNSYVNIDNRPVIINMESYGFLYGLDVYDKIPSGHLPTDINTSTAQNWIRAFGGCTILTTLPDPFYDTSNATNMSWMFESCRDLTTVPNFDTSKVTNMQGMFTYCSNLTTIPNFNTSNVTGMMGMFFYCENLTTVPNFDTSNVTNMDSMFFYCRNLTTVPNFDISNVTDIGSMFDGCSNIQGNLYIESNNVSTADYLFDSSSKYIKNIYCHANTQTYNTIYTAMGNNTYNADWNAYLKTF